MNQFLDGQMLNMKRKGMTALLKKRNIPVIILSNYAPSAAYKNSSEEKLAPFLRRLELVDCNLEHSQEKNKSLLGINKSNTSGKNRISIGSSTSSCSNPKHIQCTTVYISNSSSITRIVNRFQIQRLKYFDISS